MKFNPGCSDGPRSTKVLGDVVVKRTGTKVRSVTSGRSVVHTPSRDGGPRIRRRESCMTKRCGVFAGSDLSVNVLSEVVFSRWVVGVCPLVKDESFVVIL